MTLKKRFNRMTSKKRLAQALGLSLAVYGANNISNGINDYKLQPSRTSTLRVEENHGDIDFFRNTKYIGKIPDADLGHLAEEDIKEMKINYDRFSEQVYSVSINGEDPVLCGLNNTPISRDHRVDDTDIMNLATCLGADSFVQTAESGLTNMLGKLGERIGYTMIGEKSSKPSKPSPPSNVSYNRNMI